jgi:hypothetical protein
MMEEIMENEEIARAFIEAKAVDFEAMGSLVAKLGPQLAVSQVAPKFVLVGRPFVVACMLTARDSAALVGQFQNAELSREVMGE